MMNAIYVDDERSAHVNFCYDMRERTEFKSLNCFFKGADALAFAQDHVIDCAFLDIDLGGGETGLDLATALKQMHPDVEVVFVTAYDQYAREAYRVGGRSFLTKPYTQEELDSTIALLQKLTYTHRSELVQSDRSKNQVEVKTFGNFDLLVDNRPVAFKNSKAKELLAFLVDQRGGTVNGAQIFLALWDHLEYSSVTSTYVRRTVRALKEELETAGVSDIFLSRRNCYSVDTSRFLCDYYQLLEGNKTPSASITTNICANIPGVRAPSPSSTGKYTTLKKGKRRFSPSISL